MTNIFAIKQPLQATSSKESNLFTASPGVQSSTDLKSVTPDLFAGAGHKDSGLLFRGAQHAKPDQKTDPSNIFGGVSQSPSNIFTASKPVSTLFGDTGSSNKGLFGAKVGSLTGDKK